MLKPSRTLVVEAAVILSALGVGLFLYGTGSFPLVSPSPIDPGSAARMPAEVSGGDYVSSDTCRSCHPGEYASWQTSYHRSMTRVADRTSVEGDFDGVVLEGKGHRVRLSQEDGRFYFQELHEDRPPSPKTQILMVTGSHHYQVYWYSQSQDRKVHIFPFVYLFRDQRWVPRGSEMLGPPSNHVVKAVWNKSCLTCHSTNPLPRVEHRKTATEVTEFGIACEACHGPGEAHVEAMRDPFVRLASHLGVGEGPLVSGPESWSQEASTAVCGQCHSYFLRHGEFNEKGHLFRPGGEDLSVDRRMLNHRETVERYAKEYREHFATAHAGDVEPHEEWVHPEDKRWFSDVFWPDGVLRPIGREYTAIEPSPCFQQGEMTCSSCHEMHATGGADRLEQWRASQLKPGMDGDLACTQCHPMQPAQVAAHTHHEPGSPGSECLSCHMPKNAYGLLSARTNHHLQSPDAFTSSRAVGRVGACNICHQDKTLAWTAEHLEAWYGQEPPPLTDQERGLALLVQHATKGHAAQRVLAASLLGWEGQVGDRGWQVPFLLRLLDDDYDAVRIVAYRSLQSFPGFEDLQFDYMADAPERVEAIARLQADAVSVDFQLPGPVFLGDPEGRMDEERYSALRAERDLTPMWIGE